jgi:hypothetical protein
MANKATFTYDDASLKRALTDLPDRIDAYVHATVDYGSQKVVAYAKQNAPWRDRTGAARSGLRTVTEWEPRKRHAIVLFHSVLYGIWLEVRFAGRYAIILPTLQVQGPEVMRLLNRLFDRLGTGGIR